MLPESDAAVPPIEAGGVLLHIGPPKTGSTAVQNALHTQRDELARHGVRYAGSAFRPKEASWAVLGIGPAIGREKPTIEAWHEIVAEVHEHTDVRVCVSSEDFARAGTPAVAARIVADLGADRVHLVHVVRRLDRLLPSLWQERVKAKLALPYEEWLELVLQEESRHHEWRNLWRPHYVGGIVERWGAVVPPERLTLICSDDTDRRLIPATFEDLLGLPSGMLTVDHPSLQVANRSLTGNEAELLRRINVVAVRDGWTPKEYLWLCQSGIVGAFRSTDPAGTDQRIPPLPDWAVRRVAEISRRQVDAIGSSGARIVGDPDRLLLDGSSSGAAQEPVSTVSLDTAVNAVLGAVSGGRRLRSADRRAARRKAARRPEQRPASDLTSGELLRLLAGRAGSRLRR